MAGRDVGFIVDDEYKAWIENIKSRIKHSQIKASVKVNYEMLDLYWDIGRDIVAKQKNAKWGEAFLATMSKDLRNTFFQYVRVFGAKFEKYTLLVQIL